MSFFEKRHGSFYLVEKTNPSVLSPDGKRILSMMDDISFVIQIWDSAVVLVRVGPKGRLALWVAAKASPVMDLRIITFPKDFPLEEIEMCRANSSYLEPLLRRVFPEALTNVNTAPLLTSEAT